MNIILLCNAGMSTGLMQIKLEEAAKEKGIDAQIKAIPLSDVDSYAEEADAFLLGPQIRFAAKDIQKIADGRPVQVIAPQDFGMLNGKKVLDDLLKECI